MPGTIRITVKELANLKSPAGRKYSIQVILGSKTQETPQATAKAIEDAGVTSTRSYNVDFSFTDFTLKDQVDFNLLDAKGVSVGTASLPVKGIVVKGSREDCLSLSHGGELHVVTSFSLTDSEKAKLAAVKANAMKRKMERGSGEMDRAPSLPSRIVPLDEEEGETGSRKPWREAEEDGRGLQQEQGDRGETKGEEDRKEEEEGSRKARQVAGEGEQEGEPAEASGNLPPGHEGRADIGRDGETEGALLGQGEKSVTVAAGTVSSAAPSAETAKILADLKSWRAKNEAPVTPRGSLSTPKLGDIVPEGVAKGLYAGTPGGGGEHEEFYEAQENYGEDSEGYEEGQEWEDGDGDGDGDGEDEDAEGEEENGEGERGGSSPGGPGNLLQRVLGTIVIAGAIIFLVPQLRPKKT